MADPAFKLDYDVTDEQLIAFGISKRTIELSRQPFMRKSNGKGFEMPGLDLQYALAVWDAKDQVSLAALCINNPGRGHVSFPPGDPYMGFVRAR